MPLLGEFLHSLIKKSGGNPDDEAVKNFLLNGELLKIEIPEDITTALDKGLISIKDAKNNHPDIKPHYTELSLKTIDKTIEKLLEELEIDDADKADILSEGSTYKRVPLLMKKVKELEARKSIGNKDEKESIKKQIDDLNRQLREAKEKEKTLESDYDKKLNDYKLNNEIVSLFGQYKTTFDELEPAVKNTAVKTLLDKALSDGNAEIKFGENGKLVLLKKDGTNYYSESNQQLTPSQFLDSLLSKNKLLITSNAQNGNSGGTGNGTPAAGGSGVDTGRNPAAGSGDKGTVNHALKNKIKESMEAFTANSTPNSANGSAGF